MCLLPSLAPGSLRQVLILLVFSFSLIIPNEYAKGQNSPSLTLSTQSATCPENGKISASITGVDQNDISNLSFDLFLVPNLNDPIQSNASGEFTGLPAGTYRVTAGGESGGQPFSLDRNAIVAQDVKDFRFSVASQSVCGEKDGVIEVVVNEGVAQTFELIGPVAFPPQETPVFSGLSEGSYTIRVTDECGETRTQNYRLESLRFGINPTIQEFKPLLPSCSTVTVGHALQTPYLSNAFPLEVTLEVFNPSASLFETIHLTVNESDLEGGMFFTEIPFFPENRYSYTISAVDNCGLSSEKISFEVNRKIAISDDLRWGAGMCGMRRLSVKPLFAVPPFTIRFDRFPDGFDPAVANSEYPGPYTEENIFFGSPANPIPDGTYTLSVEDACGNTASISVNHRTIVSAPSFTVLKSCAPGFGDLELMNFDYFLESVTLMQGPQSFSSAYPIDLSQHISKDDKRRFLLTELPSGDYVFEVSTSCGETTFRRPVTIVGTSTTTEEIHVEENCGSFDIALNYQSDIPPAQNLRFGLQKKDIRTGEWVHPRTGRVYVDGSELTNTNSILLANGQTNFNFSFTGEFRIVKSVRTFRNGEDILPGESRFTFCIEPVEEFTFAGRSVIESVNAFSCGDDSFDVYLATNGYNPVTFSIISINGVPVNVQNGTNPLFSNLEPGRYQFRTVDRCGTTSTTALTLFENNLPVITPRNLCEDEDGELRLPFFEQVSYEWYREDAPEIILSRENTLSFAPFSIISHQGIYKVRISHPDPASCINEVLEFTIDPEQLDAQAGIGQEAQICYGTTVNLFDHLSAPFGTYGTWTDFNETGNLAGNLWDTEGLAPGVYEFGYEIVGLCSGEDSTIVRLTILPPVNAPEGDAFQEFCESGELTLEDIVLVGENIRWHSTPSGNQPIAPQTLLVNENTYYAEQVIEGCPSAERLAVTVRLYPPLTNPEIQGNQVVFQLEPVAPIAGADPEGGKGPISFTWEQSSDGASWIGIPQANGTAIEPGLLLSDTYFRRIARDQLCGEVISNAILVEVQVAPILAADDSYGPLKGFQENVLPISENDRFLGRPVTPGEVTYQLVSTTNETGGAVNLQARIDEDGFLILPSGSTPGNYLITYQLCQAAIPGNCSLATVTVWIGAIDVVITKEVDRQRAVEGEIITFTITATNNSPFPLESIKLDDQLPSGLLFLSASQSSVENYVWIVDSLSPSETSSISFDVIATRDGEYINEVTVSVEDFSASASSPPLIVRARETDLTITKTVTLVEIFDGDEFFYQIDVRNNGIDDGIDVLINNRIPQGLRFLDWEFETTGGDMNPVLLNSGQIQTWNVSHFPVDGILTLRLRVLALADGLFTNEAWVASEINDPNPTDNSAEVSKRVNPLFIPNVIKPDNDGKNETFIIRADHKFDKIRLVIFNRWGDPVFQSADYQNDWDAAGLNAGTYYYQVSGNLPSGEEIRYKGWVQVIK